LTYNLLYNKKSYTLSEGCEISGFRHKGDENCALQGYYRASCGNFLPMVWDNILWLTKMLTGRPINKYGETLPNANASKFKEEFLLS